jgi:hypothetical protein
MRLGIFKKEETGKITGIRSFSLNLSLKVRKMAVIKFDAPKYRGTILLTLPRFSGHNRAGSEGSRSVQNEECEARIYA